jgi:hypothetical protein
MNFDPLLLFGKLKDMYDYWRGLHPAPGILPKRAQVTMKDLKPFLPYVSLFERRPPDNDYYYRLMGSGFTGSRIGDPTGKRVKDVLPESLLPSLLDGLDWVAGRGTPFMGKASYVDFEGFEKHYTRLILPLAEDGINTDVLMLYGHPEN